MAQLFKYKAPRKTKLDAITFRGFGGGWNTVFDDLSMDPRFMTTAKNVFRQPSGASKVRFGSKWRADGYDVCASATSIIDMDYFYGRLVCVTNSGEIFTMDDDGDLELIWDSTIAGALPGAPSGWGSSFTTADFVHFRDTLIIHNGVDKPISIDTSFDVTYLQDLATGSNVNVPIGKYGCVVSNFHCVAGIPAFPTTVYISSSGTAGVFPGDAAPNNSISVDVGAYAPEGSVEIRGIAGFRTNLIVFFQAQALVITLGLVSDVQTPTFPDSMPKFGVLGHRCITQLANDLQFADLYGVSSAKRNLFSGLFDSKHLSEYIENEYRSGVGTLTEVQQSESTFAVHDPIEKATMVFIPGGKVFVYSASEELRYRGWSYYEDQDWTCGCTSFLGRVFYAKGMRIFQKGNAVYTDESYHADRLLDRDDAWGNSVDYTIGALAFDTDDEKSYECLVTHTSSSDLSFATERTNFPNRWIEYTGNAIDFDMEMPWIDGRDPMKTKHLQFGKVASKGTAEFALKIYVDNLYKDEDGVEIYDPALSIDLIGNDAVGYGGDAGPYGAGRVSNDPRLYRMPCKFKTIKFRFTGSVKKPLIIANASFLFEKGKFKR